MAALVAAGSTVVGIYIVTPAFQNMRLREENARLELQLEEKQTALLESREKTWDFVCAQFALRAKTISLSSFFGYYKAVPAETEKGVGDVLGVKDFLAIGTGRGALEQASEAEEFVLLLKTDREKFDELVSQTIKKNSDKLSVPLFSEPASDGDLSKSWSDFFKGATAAQKDFAVILEEFRDTCLRSNPAKQEASSGA